MSPDPGAILADSIRNHLEGEKVTFYDQPADLSKVSVPCVVVYPAGTQVESATYGLRESWDLLAITSLGAKDQGMRKQRDITARIVLAATRCGARYQGTTAPEVLDQKDAIKGIVQVHQVSFTYNAKELANA